MFRGAWNFVKRHKKKFIFTGIVVGGAVVLGKYAKKKFLEFQEQEASDCLTQAKKLHHFDSNQRTGNMTVLALLPSLRESLMSLLDSEALTAQLKDKPSNKVEIWEELKLLSFTRTIVGVYSCCILIVILRVQLNIIGGYLYLDTLFNRNGLSPDPAMATPEVQRRYLENMQYIMGEGLHSLAEAVRVAVKDVFEEVGLKQQVSLFDLQVYLDRVRKQLEYRQANGYHDAQATSLVKYMLPPDDTVLEASQMSREDLILSKLMKETQELVQSSDFHSVLTTCLDTGFTRLVDKMAEYFKPTEHTNGTISNPNELAMPLAKIIPIMNGLIHTVCADAPNQFVQELLVKEQVKDFAANIYEAFSVADPATTMG